MEVSETLKNAWSAVEEAELPERIQEAAFREAVRLPTPEVKAPARSLETAGTPTTNGETEDGSPTRSESEILDRVAAQTGVAKSQLEELVHLDGDTLRVSVPGLKLGRNNADRARAVAQITITRGFGMEESETSLELIRAECDRLRVYDQGNFSSHMKALNGYIITGAGSSRRMRAKSAGVQAFPALVEALMKSE